MQVAAPWVDVRMAPLTRPRERRREGPQNDELRLDLEVRCGGAEILFGDATYHRELLAQRIGS